MIKKFALLFLLGFGIQALAKEPKNPRVLDTFHPKLIDGYNLWLRADLLYFFPNEKSIAMTNEQTNLFTSADVTQKRVVDPNFHWDLGYRIGVGYVFRSSCWDMALLWTHFNSNIHQHRSTHGDIGKGMFPIWSLSDDILPYDWVANAKMKWKLRLNLLDLDFGRSFGWKKTFFLRPYLGLRTTWIDQDIDVQYGGGIFANGLNLAALDSTFGKDNIKMDNDFWGIGPILGLEPQINLGKGFRLYGAASATVNFGYFDVEQKETYLTSTRFHRDRHLNRCSWIFDATAGILWKTFLKEQRFALTFGAGWEYHIFFDQVKLQKDEFGLVSHNRDLTLNGIDISAQFDF